MRKLTDWIVLFFPIVGGLHRMFALAIFFEVLASCLEAGMPVISALKHAIGATPNLAVARYLEPAIPFVRDGESISEALRQCHMLNREALSMIAADEMAGTYGTLMRRLAEYYREDVTNESKTFLKLISTGFIFPVAVGFFVNPLAMAPVAFLLSFLLFLL